MTTEMPHNSPPERGRQSGRDDTATTERSAPPERNRGRWIVLVIAVGLVIVPVVWTAIPVEIARWYQAAALEAELDGNDTRGLELIDRAVSWSPTQPELWVARASFYLKLKKLDLALADCNRALELEPNDSVFLLYQRAMVYQRMGKHDLALADVDRIVELAGRAPQRERLAGTGDFAMSYDNALNLRAYSRALAKRDIAAGLADIDEAFERLGSESSGAYLDTRGYLRYLNGDLEAALLDLERAVELAEAERQADKQLEKPGDPRLWRLRQQRLEEQLAVLYHHRGLVYEKLGQKERADEDLRRADQYGYSPEDGIW